MRLPTTENILYSILLLSYGVGMLAWGFQASEKAETEREQTASCEADNTRLQELAQTQGQLIQVLEERIKLTEEIREIEKGMSEIDEDIIRNQDLLIEKLR